MSVYTLSDRGAKQLKQEEGLRLQVYLCASGRPTIGYGHVLHPGEPTTITKAQAEAFFITDVAARLPALNEFRDLKQHEADALLIFIYNIGNDAWHNSTARRLLLRKAPAAEITRQMKRWIHDDHGHVIPGLKDRQARTAKLYETGVYSW